MRVHEAKTSACVYAQCQNVLTRIYASCAHIFPSNLIVHYYVMTLNFKLVRDPRYFQNNADHAHKMHKCRCTLSTSACACFRFICARICTDLYQNFHGGPLLFCAVRFFLASTVYESQLETEADEVETGSKTKCLALLCKQHPWEAPSSFVNL